LLAPITPHTSEHVWGQLLRRPGTVLTSGWPTGAEPDFVMQRAAQYIEDFIPDLRKQIQKAEAPPKKAKPGTQVVAQQVVHADVFVAEQFIGWQQKVLQALQAAYQPATKDFAGDVTAKVMAALQEEQAMAGKSEKEVKALALPFAKFKMEEAKAGGPQVLDVKLPFNERELLEDNLSYITRTLKLESLAVHRVTDDQAVAALGKPVDVAAAYPGCPVCVLKTQAASS
ncbi:hypothetical protein V8C86DRAFT_1623510, partial [Haematococcus lacustris]